MNSSIPIDNIDSARAESAVVILGDLNKNLGPIGLCPSSIPKLLIPPYGIAWNRRALAAVTTKRINQLFQRHRHLKLKKSEYDRSSAFFQQDFITAAHLPSEFREWEVISERFRLDLQHGRPNILAVLTFLTARAFLRPSSCPRLSPKGWNCYVSDQNSRAWSALYGELHALLSPQLLRPAPT